MKYTKQILTTVLVVAITVVTAVATMHTANVHAQSTECNLDIELGSTYLDSESLGAISLLPGLTCSGYSDLPTSAYVHYQIKMADPADVAAYRAVNSTILRDSDIFTPLGEEKVLSATWDSDYYDWRTAELPTFTEHAAEWKQSFTDKYIIIVVTRVSGFARYTPTIVSAPSYLVRALSESKSNTYTPVVDTTTPVVDTADTDTPVVDTPTVDTPVVDTADTEVKRDERASQGVGAIRPGYLTCLIAERKNCGSVNTDAWETIGLHRGM